SSIFVPYIKSLNLDPIAIAAPDMGGAKRANAYSRFLNSSLVVCHKSREKANQVGEMTVIGEVEGKHVVILDDMVDTAGTMTMAADLMMEKGAASVRAFATHGVLSGSAYERIRDSRITELVVTDTIPLRTDKDTSKIRVLSVADLFADVINKVYNYQSISDRFII
ncbi:MAG TPA: ribose-phosphate diphosphokinase, partial [Tenuifilaceae bacterium]|nr:ribose-phosphate diphosphokinase [Tenuifilaceae bacterium]